jgi:endonuclease G
MLKRSRLGCRQAVQALAIIAAVLVFVPRSHADPLADCAQHVKYGAPSEAATVLCRLAYAVSHDGARKVPRWVAYHVTATLMQGPVARTDDFRADPDLPSGQRAELSDYAGSGYDRGHMMPAAKNQWAERPMRESFLLSNMAPQVGIGFNRHVWAQLEARVRQWAVERGELHVVTGPVFVGGPLGFIGSNRVAVPTHFFKIVFDPVRVQVIAFLLPNAALPTQTLPAYITSVHHVERLTALDFHNRLDDAVEVLVENTISEMW